MPKSLSVDYNQLRWNRLLLNGFWLCLLLSVAVECIYMYTAPAPRDSSYFWMYVARPTAVLTVVILLAEAGIRFMAKQHDYILISCAALFAIVINILASSETYLLILLFFPLFVGFFFLKLDKLIFAIAISFLSFGLICFYKESIQNIDPGPVSGVLSIMIFLTLMLVGMLFRANELWEHIRSVNLTSARRRYIRLSVEDIATKDMTTNLLNLTTFHEQLAQLIKLSESTGEPLHAAYVDIDNFRSVNESYGFRAGDEVLRAVAGIIAGMTGSREVVARYREDKFAVLFIGIPFQHAYDKLESIRLAIAAAPQRVMNGASVTVSAGLSVYSTGIGSDMLLRRTYLALRDAKALGRNRTKINVALNRKSSLD